jgi:hypothetical protein
MKEKIDFFSKASSVLGFTHPKLNDGEINIFFHPTRWRRSIRKIMAVTIIISGPLWFFSCIAFFATGMIILITLLPITGIFIAMESLWKPTQEEKEIEVKKATHKELKYGLSIIKTDEIEKIQRRKNG